MSDKKSSNTPTRPVGKSQVRNSNEKAVQTMAKALQIVNQQQSGQQTQSTNPPAKKD